jgi:hypothetical protein
MGKTNRDGSLVAKISPQAQYAYRSYNREVGLEVLRSAALSRAIVNK